MSDILTVGKVQQDKKTISAAEQYVNSLNEKEKKAYEIARSHLGTSFTIEKSIGFIKWKKSQL